MPIDKFIKRPYSIVEYDPVWAQRFEEIRKNLQDIFSNKALDIIHVGSTAIVGMSAKPIIDALVVVEKMSDFSKEKELMEKMGYSWEDNYIDSDTILFTKEDSDKRRLENIHICPKDSVKALQFIYVTEYLNNNPEFVREYSELKKNLYTMFPDDYPAYRAGKQALLEKMYHAAYEEKNLKAPHNFSFIK